MKYIINIIIVLITISTFAQKTIHGTITNSYTQDPIPDVSVKIEGSEKGTNSDFDGKFILNNINQSTVTLIFSSVGYKENRVIVVLENTTQEVNVALDEAIFEIDEIIIATPFNKLQSENVVKVTHKSLSSMERKGIQNIMDGVSQISGVTQMSTGSGISKPVIRGLAGSRVLVYNQGVRLENFQFGDFHGIGINEAGINSVEVIKGPASLLYGSDALGGVLYLVPERYAPKGKTKVNIKSKYTSNTLGFNNTVGVKSSTDKFQFLIRGAMNTNADYAVSGGERVTNSRYNDVDIKAGLGFTLKNVSSDIRYNVNNAENGIPHSIGLQETTYDLTGKHQNLENHVLSAKTEIALKNSKIETNIGHTWHNRKLLIEEATKIGMQLNTLNYDAKWHLPKWNKLESIIGVQGMLQSNENFGENILLPDANSNNIGIFTTLHYQYKNSILQGGIRYDTKNILTKDVHEIGHTNYRAGFDKDLESFTSSIGLKTTIFKNTYLRLNLASGFRAPNLSELSSKGIHSGRIEIGNAALENEQNLQADFSLEYSNTHVEFFTNAFVNTINDYIYLAPNGMTQGDYAVYQYEQSNAQLYGGEIGIHLHPHAWHWLHIDSSFETVTGQLEDKSYLPLIPANQWKNQLRVTNNCKLKQLKKYYLNLVINHTFEAINVSDFEAQQDAYTLLNSSIGSEFVFDKINVNFNISAHNILDKKYISHLSILRENEVPNMGRNIIIGVNVNF